MLSRRFALPAEGEFLPLPPPESPAAERQPRDLWLRIATFATLLGAILTILYAWFLVHPQMLPATPAGMGWTSYQRVLVPLLAVAAVAGVLLLERAAAAGVVLMIAGTVFGLGGGAVWLLPGTVLGCIWAARRHRAARATLGFLLLVPGVAACYYALMSGLGLLSGVPLYGGPAVAQPTSLGQALAPLEYLPLALLGAWLLVCPLAVRRSGTATAIATGAELEATESSGNGVH